MATKNLLVRVGVDLSDLQAGTKAAQKSFREMANVRKTEALNERSGLLRELSSAEAKVNKLETDYRRLVQDGGQSKQESAWMRQLKAAERELAALDKQWADKNGNDSKVIPASALKDIELLKQKINVARKAIEELRMSPKATEDAMRLAEQKTAILKNDIRAWEQTIRGIEKAFRPENESPSKEIPENVLQQYELLGRRAEEARAAIQQIRMNPESTEDAKRMAEELDNARSRAGELRGRLEEVNGTIQSAGAGQALGAIADDARTAASAVGGGLTAGVQAVISPVRSAAAHFRGLSSEVMKTAWRITKIQAVRGALNGLSTGISALVTADDGLSASLAQVRGNLATAFAPIWNAVLPAIQAAISAIATLTNYVANMMATLFGVTINGAKQSAEALGGMAGAAGGAGSAMEKLKRDGADFDILHKVSDNTASSGGGSSSNGIGTDFGGVAKAEIPDWMKKVQNVLENITDGLKRLKDGFLDAWNMDGVGERITAAWTGIRDRVLGMFVTMSEDFRQWCGELDFGPLLRSFAAMSEALLPVVDKVCTALEWGFRNVLLPFGKWAVEDAFPASLDLVTGALDLLDAAIGDCQPAFDWLLEKFLQPLAEWNGSIIVSALETMADVLHMVASALRMVKALLKGNVEEFEYWKTEAGGYVEEFSDNTVGFLQDWSKQSREVFGEFGDFINGTIIGQLFPGMSGTILSFVYGAVQGFEQFRDGVTESVRQAHGRAARDIEGLRTDGETSIGLFSGNTLRALANWSARTMAGVQGWASSTLAAVSGWVGSVVSQFGSFGAQAGNAVSSAVGNISSIIGGMISSAWGWGSDFIGNFASGVRNAMNGLLDTVRSMASDIASFLHFSVPDKGPLATADTWMPDMIDLLSAGIVQNKGQLIGRIEQMTGQMELAMAGGGVTWRSAALAGSYGSGPRRDNDDLIATMRSGFRQVVQAVNDKDLLVELDGSSMSRTVTRNQNRYTRMNGRPVVTG